MKKLIKSKSIDLISKVIESTDDLKLIQFVLLCSIGTKIGELFNSLSLDNKIKIIEESHHGLVKMILDDMFSNDIVDLMQDLPKDLEKKILLSTSVEARKKINQILNYPVDEAGGIMNPEFMVLRCSTTVLDAIQFIRDHREQHESYSICYAVDDDFVLKGYVEFDDLVFANDYSENIGDIMHTDVTSVTISESIENITSIFDKYSLDRVAVIDDNGCIVGIIYANDVLPAMMETNQKQLFRMAGILETQTPYISASIFKIVKSRIGWLILLLLVTTITTLIIQQFTTHVGGQYVVSLTSLLLVPLVTAVCGTSGNSGTQTSTSIIRALALGEVTKNEYGKVFLKEFLVSLVIGTFLAIFNFVRLIVYFLIFPISDADIVNEKGFISITDPFLLGLISAAIGSFALFVLVIFSKMLGAVLPIMAVKMKIDPSVMASPLIATILDSISSLVLFGFGSLFLQLLVI